MLPPGLPSSAARIGLIARLTGCPGNRAHATAQFAALVPSQIVPRTRVRSRYCLSRPRPRVIAPMPIASAAIPPCGSRHCPSHPRSSHNCQSPRVRSRYCLSRPRSRVFVLMSIAHASIPPCDHRPSSSPRSSPGPRPMPMPCHMCVQQNTERVRRLSRVCAWRHHRGRHGPQSRTVCKAKNHRARAAVCTVASEFPGSAALL